MCFKKEDTKLSEITLANLMLTVMQALVMQPINAKLRRATCRFTCVLQPIMDRDSVRKIRGYDAKIIAVKEDWLSKRDPLLSVTCGKGLQLQNYRCRQYIPSLLASTR